MFHLQRLPVIPCIRILLLCPGHLPSTTPCSWPEDLPPNSCIVLSGNDDLCHAEQVQKMVAAAGTSKVGGASTSNQVVRQL